MKLQGKFTVKTDQFPNRNPKGYTRTTQKGFWDKKTRDYEKWKDFVALCFKNQCGGLRVEDKQKVKIVTQIFYYNNRKSDPSNVHKGIEDALADKLHKKIGVREERLYKNDNFAIGEFDFDYDKENPRVEVSIYF